MIKRINEISTELEAAIETVSTLTKVLEIALKKELIKASEREADLLIESIKKSQEINKLNRKLKLLKKNDSNDSNVKKKIIK
tara:strand:+ start:132 stop:377 length:246 start_codon:yes stop_codon:yes gene_type:complete